MGLKALIVEADPFCSRVVAAALNDLPAVDTVVAVASGREALARSAHGRFGIVVLDAALPDMLGRTLLLTLKLARPDLRVVALAGASDLTIEAVEDLGRCGAAHVIARPATARAEELVAALRALTNGRPRREPACRTGTRVFGGVPEPAPRAREPVGPARSPAPDCEFWITAIAVSTGGPASLDEVIPRLPADYPHPVVMVQHMPPFFTAVMAKDLDEKSAVRVVEAGDGDRLESGTVYLAPGGRHMRVSRVGGLSRILLGDDPPLNNCRPSADVLFRSLARIRDEAGVLALVMTGMGDDGCAGVRRLKTGACRCLTQSADSCVVHGMPRAVKEAGLSDECVPLHAIARRLVELARSPSVMPTKLCLTRPGASSC